MEHLRANQEYTIANRWLSCVGDDASQREALMQRSIGWLLDTLYPRTEAERARLEGIVLEQQDEMRKLARKNESLQLRNAEAGKSNTRLGKELGAAQRELRLAREATGECIAWDF